MDLNTILIDETFRSPTLNIRDNHEICNRSSSCLVEHTRGVQSACSWNLERRLTITNLQSYRTRIETKFAVEVC